MEEVKPEINLSETDLTDFHATMGKVLPDGVPVASESMIIEALKTVQDPELMLDIYSLGVVYKIDIASNGNVNIDMTLTSPMCPIAGEMPGMVALAVSKVEGVGIVDVSLVWDPSWTLDNLDEDLKLALGIDDNISQETLKNVESKDPTSTS